MWLYFRLSLWSCIYHLFLIMWSFYLVIVIINLLIIVWNFFFDWTMNAKLRKWASDIHVILQSREIFIICFEVLEVDVFAVISSRFREWSLQIDWESLFFILCDPCKQLVNLNKLICEKAFLYLHWSLQRSKGLDLILSLSVVELFKLRVGPCK